MSYLKLKANHKNISKQPKYSLGKIKSSILSLKKKIENEQEDKRSKRKKIWNYIIGGIIGVALIWALQGSIWLFILSMLTFFTYKIWQRNRYKNPRIPEEEYVYENKKSYSRRSLKAFLWGLLFWVSSPILALVAITAEEAALVLFLITASVGFILILIGMIRAIKSLILREPNNTVAIVVLVLSLLLLLPSLLTVFLAGIF